MKTDRYPVKPQKANTNIRIIYIFMTVFVIIHVELNLKF